MEVTLVFPHQLFEKHPALHGNRPVYLIEDHLYFQQYRFHKKKLILHRASMKFYEGYLRKNGFHVTYIESIDALSSTRNLFKILHDDQVTAVHCCETSDFLLEKRLKRYSERHQIRLVTYDSPQFLNTSKDIEQYFRNKETYFLHHFYIHERKRHQILVDEGKPFGGKWSFDAENRKRLPKKLILPAYNFPARNKYVIEAEQYISMHFAGNLGSSDNFQFAVTFDDARQWFEEFLLTRLAHFGPYEDAIAVKEPYLFHGVLTPYLNTGLLTPQYLVERIIESFTRSNMPFQSVEGILRQIIGWREFVRGVYQYNSVYQRTLNFWGHRRRIPQSFYNGETDIAPVDVVIRRVLSNAYSHHIERLMVIGNIMQLCEIRPDDVYQWFMEMYIDAYDWVMVPNVYGMSQFSDGGLMSTKPYFSSSNYILRMSDFGRGEWSKIWDGLYWRFVSIHRRFLEDNLRTRMITTAFNKIDRKTISAHLKNAETFLAKHFE